MVKITLKDVASYKEKGAILETDKKINLIYGLNGTGKTILSEYLRCKSESKDEFKDCSLEGCDDKKILVYNQKFIEDNFYTEDSLKGIFTLSKENKESKEKIVTINQEKNSNIKLKEEKKSEKCCIKEKICNKKKEVEEITWKIKKQYTGGDRVLEYCLTTVAVKGNSKKLFEYIREIDKPDKPQYTIEQLKEDSELTMDKVSKLSELNVINLTDLNEIESNEIFKEIIVGNQEKEVAKLIAHFKNSDWVKAGVQYLPKESITEDVACPFCQQKTINNELSNDIKSYFDENLQIKNKELDNLQIKYKGLEKKISERLDECKSNPYINKDQFGVLILKFNKVLNKNIEKMKEKTTQLSQEIKLRSSEKEVKELNNYINKANKLIQERNIKIDNKNKTRQDIISRFWKLMRYQYDTHISNYEEHEKELFKKSKSIELQIKTLEDAILKNNENIQVEQKKGINITEAISNINNNLKSIGIEEFSIQQMEGRDLYEIIRNGNESKDDFKTFSEGEKMLISFLYFLEVCSGKEKKDEIDKNKVIVIDDPISSLSHIHIFNVSQLIKNYFLIKEAEEYIDNIFILTHSLYFFHELNRACKNNNKKLFRITKGFYGSIIVSMEKDEIYNEYESYWQVIKDYPERSSKVLLANSMRNILEYSFYFVGREKYTDAINKLDKTNISYQSFKRYIDRESHSDASNISDMKEIDVDYFKNIFKQIFDESGYIEHYNKYMDIKNEEE